MNNYGTGWLKAWPPVVTALLFIALMSPALWMSCHTPFALVDDIYDGTITNWSRHSGQFVQWLRATFVTANDSGRYRPLFEIGNFAVWSLAGPHAGWHHAIRWVEWAIGLVFWNAALLELIRTRQGGPRLFPVEARLLLPLLVFNTFVCFSPNQPMARLAPQELYTFIFLGLLFYGAMRWISALGGTARPCRIPCILALGAGFLGLSLSKETNLSLMAFFALFLLIQAIRRRSRAAILALLAAGGWLAYTVWRVKTASAASAYGHAGITITLIRQNVRWLLNDAFQWATLPLVTLLIVAGMAALLMRCFRDRGPWGASSGPLAVFVSLGSTASLLAVLLVSWLPIPRYYYPLVPLLGWILAHGLIEQQRHPGGVLQRRIVHTTAVLIAAWFIAANYFSYLMQFAAQYRSRNLECRMLDTIRTRVQEGHPVAIVINPSDTGYEVCASTKLYFDHYLPTYRNEHWSLRSMNAPIPEQGIELISPHETLNGWTATERIKGPSSYPALDALCRISAKAQGKRYPHLALDAGVHDFSYSWTVFRPADGTESP